MKDTTYLSTYISGSAKALDFFLSECYNYPKSNDLVVYPELLKAARVNMISLLLLSIKEELITKEFDTLVLDHDLKDAVDQIRNKTDLLTNTTLNSDAEIISLIRNKLGHGEFIIDFKSNKVIIDVDNEALIININALANFSVLLARAYLSSINKSSYNKTLFKVNIHNKERIENEYDVYKLLENTDAITISLKEKNDNKILPEVYNCVKSSVSLFNDNNDLDVLQKCQDYITNKYPDYEFKYEVKKLALTKEQKHTYAHNIVSVMDDRLLDNQVKAKAILLNLYNYLNQEEMTFNALNGSFVALEMLEVIKKTQSVNHDDINDYIYKNYSRPIMINECVFAASLLGFYQAMFSYSKDNYLKNMDYSMYNFDLVKPDIINAGGELISLNEQLTAVNNRLVELSNKYVEGCKQRDRIDKDNIKGIEAINNNLNNCLIRIYENNCSKKSIMDRMKYLDNPIIKKHEYNKAIVEGIRNSIAHGNYEVISSDKIASCLIRFHDIYEGEVTFSTTISFEDFHDLLVKNGKILIDYLEKIEKNTNDSVNTL